MCYCVFHIKVVPLHPQKWPLRWQFANNTLKKSSLCSERKGIGCFSFLCAYRWIKGKMTLKSKREYNIYL